MDNQMELEFAEWMAEQAVERLRGACERIEIAGSVRRRKPNPSDIEIVCVPQFQPVHVQAQLLSQHKFDEHGTYNALDARCENLRHMGVLEKRLDKNGRSAWGSGLKRAIFYQHGLPDNPANMSYVPFGPREMGFVPLDLFAAILPAQWGVIYAIRTGPGDFNHLLVTDRSIGGGCPTDRKVAGGQVWDLAELPLERQIYASGLSSTKFLSFAKATGLEALETPEEEDFFEQLDVPCWSPQLRTVERLQRYLKNGT